MIKNIDKVILWMQYFEEINAVLHLQYHAVISPITPGTCNIFERRNEGILCEFWIFNITSVYCILCIPIRVLLYLSCLIHLFQLILGHHHDKTK